MQSYLEQNKPFGISKIQFTAAIQNNSQILGKNTET